MQPGFTEIKTNARYTLKQKWPEAVAVSMMLVALNLLDIILQAVLTTVFRVDTVWTALDPASFPKHSVIESIGITMFSTVYGLFVYMPFALGVLRWFWHIVHGEDCKTMEVFYYFSAPKKFFKAVLIMFLLFFRVVLGALLCLMPYVVVNILTSPEIYNFFGYSMPVVVSGLFPLTSFFELGGVVLFLFWCIRYALFFVPLFCEPELSANKIIKKSVQLTKGKLFRLLGFLCSFIGWLLLCVFVLPLIFVVPFLLSSLMVYGREELRFSKVQTTVFDLQ